ncbi:MAG TPA: DegT/DnrJ/EryC1/StrS family aminotransferase [Nitrospirales bacterium]|jgi:dTDP-4-amino-4,6-dideoxygalactose transaminase
MKPIRIVDPPTPASILAIHGGDPIRTTPMPARLALGDGEVRLIQEAIAFYRAQNTDPGYQDHFEKRYTDDFVALMGGGYADAVATGTAALYIAIAALDLPKGSEVLVSPITDPGTLSAIVLNGLTPRLVDSKPDSYNIGLEQFLSRVTSKVSAAVVVHSIGQSCEIDKIADAARERGIKIIEDCSQSHGAKLGGKPVGVFGDIAAFSTMYRKAHISGAAGGIVYTRNLELFRRALAHADRGKPRWRPDFDDRNPATYLFPALNLHTDEISCAIGISSLSRLTDTIVRRLAFVADLSGRLIDEAVVCQPYGYSPSDSPFIYPILVDPTRISCSKTEFAKAVEKEGIALNPHYRYVVAEWPFLTSYLSDDFDTPNARAIRDRSFCLYLNENYGEQEAADVAGAILKVERHFRR